jgi:hypothetical protein
MSSKQLLVLVRLHEGNSSHPWYDILDLFHMTNPVKLRKSIASVIPAHHPRPVQRNPMAAYIKFREQNKENKRILERCLE